MHPLPQAHEVVDLTEHEEPHAATPTRSPKRNILESECAAGASSKSTANPTSKRARLSSSSERESTPSSHTLRQTPQSPRAPQGGRYTSNEAGDLNIGPPTPTTSGDHGAESPYDSAEVADRYCKSYVDPASPTPLRDPRSFSIKPPCWRRWPTGRYMRLVDYARDQLNPVAFATQEGISVEEVQHLFNAMFCEFVYDRAEETKKRCERSMEQIFDTYRIHGESVRTWGIRGKYHGRGELTAVRRDAVELISERTAGKVVLKATLLSGDDWKYLKASLNNEQFATLKDGLDGRGEEESGSGTGA